MKRKANNNKKKLLPLYAILILSLGSMAGFAIALLVEYYTVRQGQAFYSALSVDFVPRFGGHSQPNPTGASGEIAAVREHVPFVDFDEMREIFPNIVAWIQSEGTVINYPIVRGRDNDFYLYHLPDGSRHSMGSIFLDYRNAVNFSDPVIMIYGHDMRSGDMFGSLRHYADQNYFEQHYSMYISTPYQNFRLMILAGYVLNSLYEVPPMYFRSEADFDMYINNIKSRSVFRSQVDASYGDQLVLLATCTPGGSDDERLIIVTRLDDMY